MASKVKLSSCFGGHSVIPGVSRDAPAFIASLDFGTTFSGFAFCRSYASSDQIDMFSDWPGTMQAHASASIKTVTSLLYERVASDEWVLREWGWPARIVHNEKELRSSKDAQGRPTSSRWFRTERFKLNLSDDKSQWEKLAPGLTVDRCITDILRVLGDLCFARIQENDRRTRREDVQWCLTVPAMWSDKAKQRMKKYAIDAGLTTADGRFPVLIVLEPEAASFYSLYNVENRGNQRKDLITDSCLVVDAGGGTVDLAVHRTNPKTRKLEEVTETEGGLCGGSYVNLQFLEYLKTLPWLLALLSSPLATVSDGKKAATVAYLLQQFEALKHSYGNNSYVGTIELPNLPAEILDKYFPGAESPEITLSDATMRSFFDPVVEQVLALIQRRLDKAREANLDCKKMLLVGGFSANDYLVNRIRGRFALQLLGEENIVRPEQPRAAVLKGAIMYGLHPEKFGSRICKRTYGIKTLQKWTDASRPEVKQIHDGKEYAYDHFKIYVKAGDHVPVNKSVTEVPRPKEPGSQVVDIEIWSTRAHDVSRVTEPGVELETSMVVDLGPKVAKNERRRVKVSMYFGDTAIKVVATPQTGWFRRKVAGESRVLQLAQ